MNKTIYPPGTDSDGNAKNSFSFTSRWKYNFSVANSNGTYKYVLSSGPNSASTQIYFDLTSIPTSAKLVSAIMTWSRSTSNSGTVSGMGTYGATAATVNNTNGINTKYVKISEEYADFTEQIELGKINAFNFYYKPSINSSITTGLQSSSGISASASVSGSNITLAVTYEAGGYIYHCENGILVGYQLVHVENGQLIPYQFYHTENGILIPY